MTQVLSREEYLDLCPVEAAEPYPKAAPAAVSELMKRGCNLFRETSNEREPSRGRAVEKLKNLIRRDLISAPRAADEYRRWTAESLDEAADYFDRKADWSSEAVMCDVRGVRYADYLRALWDAYRQAIDEYGSVALDVLDREPNRDHFILHFHPPRAPKVWFTLAYDTRRQIEKSAKRR